MSKKSSRSTSTTSKRKADELIMMDASVRQFYSAKAMIASNNKLPLLSMMECMDPIQERSEVKKILNLELGVNCGKNLEFNRDRKKGGKLLIATCVECQKFKCVWRATRFVDFKIQAQETDLDHGFINQDGLLVDCGTLSHQASSVSYVYCCLVCG